MSEREPSEDPGEDARVEEPLPGEGADEPEPAIISRHVDVTVLQKGEREGRRRVLHTVRRNALAALPSTLLIAVAAGVALTQSSLSWLEGADFTMAARLMVTFLLSLTLVEHTRSAAQDAAAPIFATGTPFDPTALPRSMLIAIPVAGLLGLPVMIVGRTLGSPALWVLTGPGGLLLCVLGPALFALLIVGEGISAFRPGHILEVIRELGPVYWDAARFFVAGMIASLVLVWGVDDRTWWRGPAAVVAIALAGAAIGSLARAVSGEDLEDPNEKRARAAQARR